MVVNLRVPENVGNSLTSWVTINFSRSWLLGWLVCKKRTVPDILCC